MSDSRKKKSDFKQAPLILVSPSAETKGVEFGDTSISLSETYQEAIIQAGGLPLALPGSASAELIAECVRRCDGVLLTGGDDINPELYATNVAPELARTVVPEPGGRDLRELLLVNEVFRQHKPILGICRGHQIMNVALGGDLIIDIPQQVPGTLGHRRMEKKCEVVHEAQIQPDSLLAQITGRAVLGVNSTHHQAVGRVAEPFQVSAQSQDGVVEALELKPEAAELLPFFLTVQFHPERLAKQYPEHQAIFDRFVEACRDAAPAAV